MASVHALETDSPERAQTPYTVAARRSAVRHVVTLSAALAWIYTLAVPVVFRLAGRQPGLVDAIAPWIAVPMQLLAIVSIGWILLDRSTAARPMRRFWWLVLSFTALNTLANYLWNLPPTGPVREELDGNDALYLLDYGVLTLAFAHLFVRAGGTFKSLRVWLDGATMIAVQLVALWSFFLAPSLPRALGHGITLGATLSYSFVLSVLTSMAALLCLQLPRYPGRVGVLLLVAAAVAAVAWEIIWLGSWLVDFEFIGPYFNYGDTLCFACVATAAAVAQFQPPAPSGAANPELRLDGFLPALATLMAIAMVAGTLATTKRLETWLLVCLVTLCALLLTTRQRNVRAELRTLHQQLAAREADARLTELVRRSNDLIVVVDADGLVNFASPAARLMLWMPAAHYKGTDAMRLFGTAHETSMRELLEAVRRGGDAPEVMELQVERSFANTRVFVVTAANQLSNPLINGIVVTAHDVTDQRALEREVLEAATRERVRLSAEIHDGLGQELTGIALLLHVAAKAPDPDPGRQRGQLEAIVDRVNQTIGTARDLARGLSPLHVAQGSLSGALNRLAQASKAPMRVDLRIDSAFHDGLVDGFSADHVYRIVQDALANAVRHRGGTRVDIRLGATRTHLLVSIADDGNAPAVAAADSDPGLRSMEYRARLLGGTLRVSSSGASGACVELTAPLPKATH